MFKRVFLIVILTCFSGCSFFIKSRDIISMKNFDNIIDGRFENINDFIDVFPKSVEDINFRAETIIKKIEDGVKRFLSVKSEERSFDNTARALDKLEYQLSIIDAAIEIFEMVSPDEKICKACHDAAIKLHQFAIQTFSNREIFRAFKEYVNGNALKESLNLEEKYFLKEEMKSYKRQGFDLPEEHFKKVTSLKKELAELSIEFDANINKDKSFIMVDKQDLDGLDEDFINNLQKNDDKYILGCDYPTYFNVMEYCKVEQTRKDLYFVFQNRAYPENIKILNSIINKRDELAKLLGFNSYADLDLDSQMVKKQKVSRDFLSSLVDKAKQKADKEFDMLKNDLPESVLLDENGKMYAWNGGYASAKYKKKHFNIDEREISEYFPVKSTIDKIFEIYQNFLGLKFEEVLADNLWHEDVKLFKIFDAKNNQLLGTLFLDLYPRDNKYKHACMADIVHTTKYKDVKTGSYYDVPGLIIVIANFPKATKEKPALLKHDDVVTFFHEFGHAMHGLLGKTELSNFSGTSVKRDFVEMPSQMFEEWMWDKGILKFVSSHYKTSQPLSENLIDKKIELKKLFSGSFVVRQCSLAFLALDYFADGKDKDLNQIRKDLHEKYSTHTRYESDTHFYASFGHLTGYGAKYYGYMWAKVFALDLFAEIKKHGLLDSEIGKKLVDLVLSKGGSIEPDVLLKNFLGREPNQEAFLKDLGID